VGHNAALNGIHNWNTIVGYQAMRGFTSGNISQYNTAIGAAAMVTITNGQHNTAVGNEAMPNILGGNFNTAVGNQSLFNTSSEYNTGVGIDALFHNNTGVGNTGVGKAVLGGNTTGNYNTALGYEAGVSGGNFTNATAIGYGAIADASNKVRIGNSAVTVIEGQVPFTTPSDGRFKFNVQEDVKGLDFIMQLRPVTYQFDVKRFDSQLGLQNTDNAAYNDAEMLRRTGFIAQEVENAANSTGYNFSGVIKPVKQGDHYSLSYDAFVVPLVKAVQEQQLVIDSQNKKIADLQQQLEEIKKMLKEKK
jgi:hypothetical protein